MNVNMNMKFINASYEIAGLSTCILKEPNENLLLQIGSEDVVNITDRLSAITKYEILESDIFSLSDYEVHYFTVTYLRDGQIVDSISYTKNIGERKFGSLANPALDKNLKISLLNDFSPNIISKFKLMRNQTGLTKDEIEAIIAKSNELKLEAEKTKSR